MRIITRPAKIAGVPRSQRELLDMLEMVGLAMATQLFLEQ